LTLRTCVYLAFRQKLVASSHQDAATSLSIVSSFLTFR
jgi:hypothetical protein